MTKVEAIAEHIQLREQFWEIKYNPLHYTYGFVRCLFHSQSTIESASKELRRWIRDYGTARELNAKL
jgi:hypothetical protein